jgi:hypothetical protein
VGAHELVEAGRQHVATGRVREAMACFKRAADDPERGAEALSLLAAAYLLPGSLAPELALAHAHRAASHPAVGGEHLARCAAVALTAGDPSLAEELAGRAGRAGGGEALAIRATALLRLGDLAGVWDLLSKLECASGPTVFWRRLAVEASAAGSTSPWPSAGPCAAAASGPRPSPTSWSGPPPPRCSWPAWPPPPCWPLPRPSGWPPWPPLGSWPSAWARPSWPGAADLRPIAVQA